MFAVAETLLVQLIHLLPAILGVYLIFTLTKDLLFKD